jgi:hypothetical protein
MLKNLFGRSAYANYLLLLIRRRLTSNVDGRRLAHWPRLQHQETETPEPTKLHRWCCDLRIWISRLSTNVRYCEVMHGSRTASRLQ